MLPEEVKFFKDDRLTVSLHLSPHKAVIGCKRWRSHSGRHPRVHLLAKRTTGELVHVADITLVQRTIVTLHGTSRSGQIKKRLFGIQSKAGPMALHGVLQHHIGDL